MIYAIHINGKSFGIQERDVSAVKEVQRVHRLPLADPVLAGLASIEGQSVNLFDLAACLGYLTSLESSAGIALFPAGGGDGDAFLVRDRSMGKPVQAESLLALPDHLATGIINSCAVISGVPVPLISLTGLYGRLKGGLLDPAEPAFPARRGCELSVSRLQQQDMRLLKIAGETFAIPSASVGGRTFPLPVLSELPMAPSHMAGIILLDGKICTVMDPAAALGIKGQRDPDQILPLSDGSFAVLTEVMSGGLDSGHFKVVRTPAPFRSSLIPCVIIVKDLLLPVLEPEALEFPGGSAFSRVDYETSSDFRQQFGKRKILMHVFRVGGQRFGIPTSLVGDVIDLLPVREMAGSRPVAIGAAACGDAVLPVLDLEVCFGGRSEPGPGWSMIRLKDGTFEALILAETVQTDIPVQVDKQLDLPPELDGRYISGCFVEDNELCLILDVPAFVSHITRGTRPGSMVRLSIGGHENRIVLEGLMSDETASGPPGESRQGGVSMSPEVQLPAPGIPCEAEPYSGRDDGVSSGVPEAPDSRSEGLHPAPACHSGGEDSFSSEDDHAVVTEIRASDPGYASPFDSNPDIPETGRDREPVTRKPEPSLNQAKMSGDEGDEGLSSEPGISADFMTAGSSNSQDMGIRVSPGRESIGAPPQGRDGSQGEQGNSSAGGAGPIDGPRAGTGRIRKGLLLVCAIFLTLAVGLFFLRDNFFRSVNGGITEKKGPSVEEQKSFRETERVSQSDRVDHSITVSPVDEDRKDLTDPLSMGRDNEEQAGEKVPATGTESLEVPSAEEVEMPELVMKLTPGSETVLVEKRITGPEVNTQGKPIVHIVKRGDTLWHIARLYTGNPFRYPVLAEASEIKDPDLIYPGQKIFIVLGREE